MRNLATVLAVAFLSIVSQAQETPSLGDVARQARAQKQQESQDGADVKDTGATAAAPSAREGQPPKTSHVFTNDDLPEHSGLGASAHRAALPGASPVESPASHEAEGRRWKEEILSQKSTIAELQSQIATLSNSIHYAVRGVRWNEAQQRKQQQVEVLKSRLEEQQRRFEETQDAARRRGYGSSVWDP